MRDFGLCAASLVDSDILGIYFSFCGRLECFSGVLEEEEKEVVSWAFNSISEFPIASCYTFYAKALRSFE